MEEGCEERLANYGQKSLSKNTIDFLIRILQLRHFIDIYTDSELLSNVLEVKDLYYPFIRYTNILNTFNNEMTYSMEYTSSELRTYGNKMDIWQVNELINKCYPYENSRSVGQIEYCVNYMNLEDKVTPMFMNSNYIKLHKTTNTCIYNVPKSQITEVIENPAESQTLLVCEILMDKKEHKSKLISLNEDKSLTIGKGPETSRNINVSDQELDDPQLGIECYKNREYKLLVQCLSRHYLSLVRLPIQQKWLLHQNDYYILSENEGFIISKSVCKMRDKEFISQSMYKEMSDSVIFSPRIIDDYDNLIQMDVEDEPYLIIIIILGEKTGESYKITPNREFLLGRKDNCHLKFLDPGVSNLHAKIEYIDKLGWFISNATNRGSLNGTWLALNHFQRKKNLEPSLKFPVFDKQVIHWKGGITEGKLKLVTKVGS